MATRAAGSSRTAPVLTIGLVLTAAYVAAVIWSMDRADYSVWMALLLAPVLVVVTIPALRRQAARERDSRLLRLLTWALVLKLLASLLRFYVAFGLYGGAADAAAYHDWGTDISASFRSGVFETGLPDLHSTRFIRLFTGLVYTVVGPTKLGGFLIFSWLGFLGLFLLYRAFTIAVPEGRSRTYARFVFFFPSMLFWPSSIGKEAWMILAIGLTSYGIARALKDDIGRAVVPLVAGAWMVAVVRPHVAAMLGVGAVGAYLLKPTFQRHRQEMAVVVKGGVLVLMALGALLLVQRTDEFLRETGVREEGGVADTLERTSFRTQQGGSQFTASVFDSPGRAPVAFVTVLFRPVLPEAENFQAALAALEGSILFLWCAWRWRWILAAVKSVRRQPYVAMAIAYMGVFVLGFSSIANFGILARQRVQVLPFLFVLLAIPPRDGGEDPERRPAAAFEQVE
jgi:hypothetical protein